MTDMTDNLPADDRNSARRAMSAALPSDERQRVIDLLQFRFADDSLSMDEYERRVEAAFQATSRDELNALVADISQSPSVVPETGKIVTVLSNNERNIMTRIPRSLRIVSVLGNTELDMTGATFTAGLTEIDISATLANIEIVVPLGVRVEFAGSAFIGNFECKVPGVVGASRSSDPVIRIRGRATLASVSVCAAPARLPAAASDLIDTVRDTPRRLT
jgi:hypothetical protein